MNWNWQRNGHLNGCACSFLREEERQTRRCRGEALSKIAPRVYLAHQRGDDDMRQIADTATITLPSSAQEALQWTHKEQVGGASAPF